MQTYVYFTSYPKDNWKFKTLVAFEMSFESLHLALLLVLVFMTVANGTPPQLFDFSMTIGIGLLCSGPIAFCTQAFFIFRLYAFSHKKALSAFCSILVITQFLFTLMGSIATTSFKPQLLDRWRWFTISTLIITICADTAIAVSMRFYLKATESGIHRTSRVIDRMVVYIIATGTITSIFALASGVA